MTTKQLLKKYYKKKKRRKLTSKEKSIRCKAGQKKRYSEYLKSKEWAEIRIDLFNKRGKKCEWCDCKKSLQVHHLHYRNIFREEPEDLVILCKVCHEKEHKK